MAWSSQNGRYVAEYGQNINRWYASDSKWDKENPRDRYDYPKYRGDGQSGYPKSEHYLADRYANESRDQEKKGCYCSKCQANKCHCHQMEYYGSNCIIAMQIQLERAEVIQVDKQENILFDKIIGQSRRGIEYDFATGKFFLYQQGMYYVEWWITTDGIMGGTDTFVEFEIVTSQGQRIGAVSPNTFGQISGMAILEIMPNRCQPVSLELKNTTDGTIGFGNTPIKAGFGIIRIKE